MFIEKRRQGKKIKYYLAHSVREGNRVVKKRKYLGSDLSKKEIDSAISKFQTEFVGGKSKLFLKKYSKKDIDVPKRLRSFPVKTVEKIPSLFNKVFHANVFTLFASTESQVYSFSKRQDPHYKFSVFFIRDEEAQWFLDMNGILKVRKAIIDSSKFSAEEVFDAYHKWEKGWKSYIKMSNKLLKKDLTRLSDKELYKLFQEFYSNYLMAGSLAYMCDSFMSTGAEDWLVELLTKELSKKGVSEKVIDDVRILTSPVHLSFTLEAEYQLLKTAEKIARVFPKLPSLRGLKKEKRLYNMLKKHEMDFYWMQNNYYNVKYLDIEQMYEKIHEIIKDAKKNKMTVGELREEKENELKEIREKRHMLINNLGLSDFIRNLLKIARLFSKWKDVRKSGVYIGMYHFDKFLDEIAKRTSYTKRQLTFSIFPEIKKLLFDKIDMTKEFAEREKKTFVAISQNGYFIVGGKKADKYFKILDKQKQESVMEIRGFVASQGYARGKVRIIKKTHEMKEFKTGEILVANQTTPEYLPVMKKAAAIITEQGGITSHAAVVSREIGVPCIIGTKICTKALFNGETVEVDARNGIVRRER